MPRISSLRSPSDWTSRFPVPERPWTHEYNAAHRELVRAAVADPRVRDRVARGRRIPAGFGGGFDERVIEYPWLFGQGLGGRVLDAGSTFNHEHILDLALPELDELTITTLEPEAQAFVERRVSYVFADLRELPFRDGWFDLTVSVSTLEHVGMDNAVYGSENARAADPAAEVARAASELRRVTRSGGRILVTVPYGTPTDHGWFRQFGAEDVQALIDAFAPRRHRLAVYRYSVGGWQRSSLRRAADARYRDFTADPSPVADHAAAARGVALLAMTV